MGGRFNYGEVIIILFYYLAALSFMYVYLICDLFLLSCLAQQTITRRTKVEMVMHLVMIPKDQWDQFSALLFTRRNLEMICKVLKTIKCRSLSIYRLLAAVSS